MALALRTTSALGREIEDVRALDDDELFAIMFPALHWSTIATASVGLAGATAAMLAAIFTEAPTVIVVATCVLTLASELGAVVTAAHVTREELKRDLGVSRRLIDRVSWARARVSLTMRPTWSKKKLRAELLPKIRALLTEAQLMEVAPPHTEGR
jgi:hypothetical protein